jgi:hypothetical protein
MKASFLALVFLLSIVIVAFAVAGGCGDDGDDDDSSSLLDDDDSDDDSDDDDTGSTFVLTSAKIDDGGMIAVQYTCENAAYERGVSPPLSWANAPEGTAFFAIICMDIDTPQGTAHWGVFDLSADVSDLADGLRPDSSLPSDAWEALNYKDEENWAGPCPPSGENHEYVFTIYALNEGMPDFDQTPTVKQMMAHIEQRTIDSAQFSGFYQRP